MLEHLSVDLAWESPHRMWKPTQSMDPMGSEKQEQADERNPHDGSPSQAASACPNLGEHAGNNYLAFPMAHHEEQSAPASDVYRAQEWESVYDADALCAGRRNLTDDGGLSLVEESRWRSYSASPVAWTNAYWHRRSVS